MAIMASSMRPFTKMFLWTAVVGILAVCNGVPIDEQAENDTIVITERSTTEAITSEMPEGHPMDDILPGTKAPVVPVEFLDVPTNLETEIGASVLLPCRTANPVVECQWSWQSLPPTYLPLPNTSIENDSIGISEASVNVTSSPAISLPLRQFPAFGNNSNDCSVRFSSTRHEQAGYWTCAARSSFDDPFTSTAPAKLTIVNNDEETVIMFEPQESELEAPLDSSTQIVCRTTIPVRECQWYWRRLNQSQPWNLDVKKFPAFGENNNDCSIKLKNVLPEQEGIWTCGARINPNSSFILSKPTQFFISEVEFVQLSRTVQIPEGETVLLRCLANKPVAECEWSWKASKNSEEATVIKKFAPHKDSDHDCSVRFKNVLQKEEGLWTCGVRLTSRGRLHEAPPATVALLPSSKVRIIETPEDTSVLNGTEATLKCVSNSRVEKCAWTWRPLGGSEESIVVKEFPSEGDLGRDCSLTLEHVTAENQGFWSCRATLAGPNSVLTTPAARLTIYEGEVKFSELSKDIQISIGGTILLRCVASSAVERCRWSLTPVNTNVTVVVKEFPAAGSEVRDCSVRLSHALGEQEGLWTCGAKLRHQENFTDAPPAKLSLIEPEPTSVTLWTEPHQMVTLACKVGPVPLESECHWIHPSDFHLTNHPNSTTRFSIYMNYSNGICTLKFTPDEEDLGKWICKFSLSSENMKMDIGSASILLLSSATDDRLGWMVGVLTSLILFIMIIAVVLVVCKTRFFSRKNSAILETIPPLSENKKESHSRYTESPAKINFRFSEQNVTPSTLNIEHVLPNRSPHFYERVEKFNGNPHQKTYENVKK